MINSLHAVVVGLGSIGNRHVSNLVDLGVGRVTIVRRPDSANQQFSPPEECDVVYSLDDALKHNPDFAILCNPTDQHVSTALECLSAGVPCLIEKPLAASLCESTKRLLAHESVAAQKSAMAYCMRYHPAYAKTHELISQNRIGPIIYAKSWFEGFLPDWHPWEDHRESYAALPSQGGGSLRTLDHEIDFLNWTLGNPIQSTGVLCNSGSIGIEADDVAHLISRHRDSITSTVTVAFCRKPASRGFEFVGQRGTICFSMDRGELILSDHGTTSETILVSDENDITQMYRDLLKNYIHHWTEGKPTDALASLSCGGASLRVIDQVVVSDEGNS